MKNQFPVRFNLFFLSVLMTGVLSFGAPAFCAVAIYGSGGVPTIVRGNARQIRLVEQEIRVSLPSRHVTTRSVFRNEGSATNITIGFPERGETGARDRFPRQGFLRNLRVHLDGKPVTVALQIPRNGSADDVYFEDNYSVYWVRGIAFKKGQTRVLQQEYSGGAATMRLTDPSGGATQLFQFSLADGAAWKGAIGHLKIVVDVVGLDSFQEVEINAPRSRPMQRVGNKLVWQSENFEPKANDILSASWWPGLKFIAVDEQMVEARGVAVSTKSIQGDYDSVYPQKREGKVWVPLRLLLEWLPAPPEGEKNELIQAAIETYFALSKGRREVLAIVGSRELEASENAQIIGRFQMSQAAYLEKGAVMVELAPIVRALGGSATLENGIVKIRWQ